MKKPVILLIVLAVVLLVALIVGQVKFEAITSAPVVMHEDVAGEHTSIRIVFSPLAAKGFIADRIVAPQGVPAFMGKMVLPREVALLCNVDMETGTTYLTWFINEQRLGPQIAQAIDGLKLSRQFPFVTFDPPAVVRDGRGSMLLRGTTQIPPLVLQTVQNQWGIVRPMESLTIEGGHLLDAVLDNRDGAAYALATGLYLGDRAVRPNEFNPLEIAQGVQFIAVVRATVDIVSDTEMVVTLRFEGTPEATPDNLQGIKFMLDQGRAQVQSLLKSRYGAQMVGTFENEGDAISGEFTISPFDSMLKGLGVPVTVAQ